MKASQPVSSQRSASPAQRTPIAVQILTDLIEMDPRTISQRIAWFGPTDRCFGWMLRRLRSGGVQQIVEFSSMAQLRSNPDCDRIVLAVRNRIDYPWDLVQELEESSTAIPWAMAVDSWWEGSRRTGIGAPGHVLMAWYRWWEGWHAWFFPSAGRSHEPQVRIFSPAHAPQDWVLSQCAEETGNLRPGATVIVVAGCEIAAAGWLSQAQLLGASGVRFKQYNPAEVRAALECDARGVHSLVLLDDTILDTHAADSFAERFSEKVRCCREASPSACLVVATAFPRWEDWLMWEQCGASYLIAKPTFGLPLASLLEFK